VLRAKHKTKTLTDTRPLYDAGCVQGQTVFPAPVWRDTRPVESATLLGLFGKAESRAFLPVFDTKADLLRFQHQDQRHAYVDFWQGLPLAKLDALLASVGKAACAKAKGYLRNKVSDTSLVECALGARYAVLSKVFCHKGEFALDALEQLDQPTVIGCAKAIGVKHGVKAATDSEFLGQRLRTNDKLGLKREAIDLIDTVAHVLAESDQSEPVARNRQRALLLVKTVRGVRATKLAATKANNKRHVIRRFNRIAKVLSLVAQGDSLQYACEQAGFGFHEGENRSRSFALAFDQSGVRQALCSDRQGQLGAIGQRSLPYPVELATPKPSVSIRIKTLDVAKAKAWRNRWEQNQAVARFAALLSVSRKTDSAIRSLLARGLASQRGLLACLLAWRTEQARRMRKALAIVQIHKANA
jgi:hypothetical protein